MEIGFKIYLFCLSGIILSGNFILSLSLYFAFAIVLKGKYMYTKLDYIICLSYLHVFLMCTMCHFHDFQNICMSTTNPPFAPDHPHVNPNDVTNGYLLPYTVTVQLGSFFKQILNLQNHDNLSKIVPVFHK